MSLPDPLPARPAPLRVDTDGSVRIGATRVTLETLLRAFWAGATAEEIVMKFPSLDLTDVYATIAYYLWNRADVDAYVAQRETDASVVRADAESRHPSAGLRERLLIRKHLAS